MISLDNYEDNFWQKIPAFCQINQNVFLNYKWQVKNSINSEAQLIKIIKDIVPKEFIIDAKKGFAFAPMAVRITPYILSLIDWSQPWHDPICKQFIPQSHHQLEHPMLKFDSLGELEDMKAPGLIHRYADKALFLALNTCPVYCRFCTRSYTVGANTKSLNKVDLNLSPKYWEEALSYIESHPEIEDIVISGGDSYNLSAAHLQNIGTRLLNIPHIRRLRLATRGLAIMPMKILTDANWLNALANIHTLGRKLYKQVALHTHFNSSQEITAISQSAMNKLFDLGITVRNQTVLLQGVNNTTEQMQLLIKRLSYINIQPYYVYQHDMVKGVEDLRTSLQTAINLEKNVRGTTAGFNTPTFVIDTPAGGGKRCVHSYEYYNRETGVSVFTSPVKPGQYFLYFDPLHSLNKEIQQAWQNQDKRQSMCLEAISSLR